jgi:hypothetical protein
LADTSPPRKSLAIFPCAGSSLQPSSMRLPTPGRCCRELTLSDLYHNVAVTAIQIAFRRLKSEFSGPHSSGQRCRQPAKRLASGVNAT